jgi:hypothetical protein
MTSNDFTDLAKRIGEVVIASATRDKDQLSWRTVRHSRLSPLGSVAHPTDVLCGPDLYRGGAGIALFLAFLGQVTGEDRFRSAAECGLNWVISNDFEIGERPGLFDGTAGLAYVCIKAGEFLCDKAIRQEGVRRFDRLVPRMSQPFDVISGDAGILLSLCACADALTELALDHIPAYAETLAAKAQPYGLAFAWAQGNRPWTGYSHGCAGIAHSLLEAYRITGATWMRSLALSAFDYEDRYQISADDDSTNWRDLRPDGKSGTDMNVWCHGSAGVGGSRVQAFCLLQDEQLIKTSLRAWSTSKSPRSPYLGLCHGQGGMIAFALDLFRMTHDDHFLIHARNMFRQSLLSDPLGGAGLSFVVKGQIDTGLMCGLSGVGLLALALANPETDCLPLFLKSSPPGCTVSPRNTSNTLSALVNRSRNEAFGRTLAIAKIGDFERVSYEEDASHSIDELCIESIAHEIVEANDSLRDVYLDAFCFESSRVLSYENDAWPSSLYELTIFDSDLCWLNRVFQATVSTTVHSQWDWRSHQDVASLERADWERTRGTFAFAFSMVESRPACIRLSPLVNAIRSFCEEPATGSALLDYLSCRIRNSSPRALQPVLREQLRQLVLAHLVEIIPQDRPNESTP